MIYKDKPKDFDAKFEVVSCFVENKGKILLLHRHDHKPEGNTWGVPAGKVENFEDISEAIAREVKQETGFSIPKNEFNYFGKVYVKYPSYDFIYHLFHLQLNKQDEIKIDLNEHKDFRWVTIKDSLKMPLIQDLDNCIKLYYKL